MRKYLKGQMSLVMIFIVAIALVLYAISLNWSRISMIKTQVTMASNTGASTLASLFASYGQAQMATTLGGSVWKVDNTGVVPALITIVILALLLVITIVTWGTTAAATVPLASALITGCLIGMGAAVVSIVIQVLWVQPGITKAWSKSIGNLPTTEEQFAETAISSMMSTLANDPVLVDDHWDLDLDGRWNIQGVAGSTPGEQVPRYAYYYADRMQDVKRPVNAVQALQNVLKDVALNLNELVSVYGSDDKDQQRYFDENSNVFYEAVGEDAYGPEGGMFRGTDAKGFFFPFMYLMNDTDVSGREPGVAMQDTGRQWIGNAYFFPHVAFHNNISGYRLLYRPFGLAAQEPFDQLVLPNIAGRRACNQSPSLSTEDCRVNRFETYTAAPGDPINYDPRQIDSVAAPASFMEVPSLTSPGYYDIDDGRFQTFGDIAWKRGREDGLHRALYEWYDPVNPCHINNTVPCRRYINYRYYLHPDDYPWPVDMPESNIKPACSPDPAINAGLGDCVSNWPRTWLDDNYDNNSKSFEVFFSKAEEILQAETTQMQLMINDQSEEWWDGFDVVAKHIDDVLKNKFLDPAISSGSWLAKLEEWLQGVGLVYIDVPSDDTKRVWCLPEENDPLLGQNEKDFIQAGIDPATGQPPVWGSLHSVIRCLEYNGGDGTAAVPGVWGRFNNCAGSTSLSAVQANCVDLPRSLVPNFNTNNVTLAYPLPELTQLQDSRLFARRQEIKFRTRAAYLKELRDRALVIRAAFENAHAYLTSQHPATEYSAHMFLGSISDTPIGFVIKLIEYLKTHDVIDETGSTLGNELIYGWQSPEDKGGYIHLVKVQASIPGYRVGLKDPPDGSLGINNNYDSWRGNDDENIKGERLPYIDTWTLGAFDQQRWYQLEARDGTVGTRVIRYDEDHASSGIIKFMNAMPLWRVVYHNPHTLKGQDHFTGTVGGADPITVLKQNCFGHHFKKRFDDNNSATYVEYFPENDSPELKQAFMLNVPFLKNTGIPGPLAACYAAAEKLLERGVVSETCAHYGVRQTGTVPVSVPQGSGSVRNHPKYDDKYSINFKRCP